MTPVGEPPSGDLSAAEQRASQEFPQPTIWDEEGAPETVYLTHARHQMTAQGWVVSSLDVGSWRPLNVGDRLVALDQNSPDEFLVEVSAVETTSSEVYYQLRHLADLDPAAEPELHSTRAWLTSP